MNYSRFGAICEVESALSQIQDFPKEGARFRVKKCHVDAIQWGGG